MIQVKKTNENSTTRWSQFLTARSPLECLCQALGTHLPVYNTSMTHPTPMPSSLSINSCSICLSSSQTISLPFLRIISPKICLTRMQYCF